MPTGFIFYGWLHVLENSEIAVLLMAGCGTGSWLEDGLRAFPGAVSTTTASTVMPTPSHARPWSWFGLLEVKEVRRHADSRAEDDDRYVHRIGLRTGGFEEPTLPAIQAALLRQLGR